MRYWLTAGLGLLLVAGCGEGDGGGEAGAGLADTVAAQPVAPATATPAPVTAAQFASLGWLEGTWRGAGTDQPTFYERYAFVDDSTMRAESSSDSTFPNPDEASGIELRGGHVFTGSESMEWTVTSIGERSVRFEPVRGAVNAFEWTSASDSAWSARLTWTDSDGEAHERVYEMRRMQ